MKRTEYLYGVQPQHFADMIYRDALRERLKLAKQFYEELQVQIDVVCRNNINSKECYELREQQHHVYKAIKHNEALLEELE